MRLRADWLPKKNVTSRGYRSTLLHLLGSKAAELCKGGNFRLTVAVSIVSNRIDTTTVTNGDPSNAFDAPAVPKSQPPRSIRTAMGVS